MTCELHDVGQNHIVADVEIVTEVNVGHQQTVLAYARLERLRGPPVDGRVFPNDGAFANLYRRLLAGELQILWQTPENAANSNFHIGRERHVALERCARRNHASVADDAVFADDR